MRWKTRWNTALCLERHGERDAMFVWSAMHGLATVMQSEAAYYLDMPQDEAQAQVLYTMESIDLALRQRGYEPL